MENELETYRKQLATNPDDVDALAALEAALVRASDWEGLVALYAERLGGLPDEEVMPVWGSLGANLGEHLGTLEDPMAIADLAYIVGRIFEDRAGNLEQAMLHYQHAFKQDSSRVDALQAARNIYVKQGNWKLVLQLYSLELQVTSEPGDQANLYFDMAEVCRDHLDELGDAALCVRNATRLAPDHPRAADFAALIESVQEASLARFEEIVAEAQKARDTRKKVPLLLEAVDVLLNAAPEDPRNETLLREILDADARNDQARILLEQYYEENQRYEDLVEYLHGRANATPRKADRIGLFQRMAEIADARFEDAEQAVQWHREVLKLDPVEHDSLNYCVDYFSQNELWEDLVRVYEAALRGRHRGGNESAMLVQIAMILWRKLEDLEQAESYFKRVKLNDPRNPLMLQFYTEYYRGRSDWKRLLATLASRQANEKTQDAKIDIGLEMAGVAEDDLGNREKAIDIWKSILKLQPDHTVARRALRRLFFETKKWNALLEFQKEDLELTPDDDVEGKVAIFQRMIEIYRDQLNLEVMVVNTFNQILQVDPMNQEALDALQERYEKGARWNDLIGILKRRAEAARAGGEDEEYVSLQRRIAQLWLDKFSNPNQAVRFLEAILELRPSDEAAIDQLIEIYRHRKDWKALFATYERQLLLLEGEARVERLQEMARIAAERLGEKDAAIDMWRQVLEVEPELEKGWTTLEGLYQQTRRWSDLADHYRAWSVRAAEAGDEKARVGWLKKLGNTYAEKVEDEAAAAEVWLEVLALNPGDLHAEGYLRELYLRKSDWDALERLYGGRGDFEGLVRLLGGAAAQESDAEGRVALYMRMARICHTHLENEEAAVECLERVLEVDPDNLDAARLLGPYYEKTERWDPMVAALEVLLRHAPEEPVAIMVRLAQVHESERGDAGAAFGWYGAAVREAPTSEELLGEYHRTAERTGRWVELVDLLTALVETLDAEALGEEAEARIRRVLADACSERLGRAEDAAEHYERVRALQGDSDAVLDALESIYKQLSKWGALLSVYDAKLATAEGAEASRILEAIGELHESVLDDVRAAREAYDRLLAHDAESLVAVQGLQRLAEREGDLPALVGFVEAELALTEGADAHASLLFRLGQLAEQREDPEQALARYADVLEKSADHIGTVQALERFLDGEHAPHAAKILEPYMRAHDEWSSLRRVLELQVDGIEDVETRAALLREVAGIREARLSDAWGAFATWERLLRLDPADESVRNELERLAGDLALWERLADLYADHGIGGPSAGTDLATASALSRRLASILEDRLGRYAEARSTLEAVMEAQGDDLELLDAVDRLASRLEDFEGLVAVCERKLALLEEAGPRRDLLFRVGDLWEEVLDRPEEAVDAYRRVRAEDTANQRAVDALERIYRNIGRWEDLADLLEQRLDEVEGDTRVALTYQLAQVLELQLDDLPRALERYAEVLAQASDHEPAAEAIEGILARGSGDDYEAQALRSRACDVLEPIYEAREEWSACIHILQCRLADAEVPADRMALQVRIARLHEDKAADPTSAFASYGAAFGDDYGNRDVLRELRRLAETLDAWDELAAVLRGPLDDAERALSMEPALRREMQGQVADLYEQQVDATADAIDFNRRIVEENPEDPEGLASLDRLYGRVGDAGAQVEIVERRARLADSGPAQAELWLRVGTLYEESLADAAAAIEALGRVRLVEPDDLRAHCALERLYAQTGAHQELVQTLLDHAERAADAGAETEGRKALLFQAADVYEVALEDADEAVSVLRTVLDIDGEDRRALGELDRLYVSLDRHDALLEILERELALAGESGERDTLEYRLGALLVSAMGEVDRAVGCYRAVLGRTPDHPESRAALEAFMDDPEVRLRAAEILMPLYESDEAWLPLRDTQRAILEDLEDEAARVAALTRIARIEEVRLGDVAAAFDTTAQAFGRSEGAAALQPELERLAGAVDGWERLMQLLDDAVLQNPDRAVELHLKLAEIADTRLGDPQRAIAEHNQVLDEAPENAVALDALEALYERVADHIQLVGVLERKANIAEALDDKKLHLYRIAELHESALEDAPAAIDTLRAVLDLDERDGHAWENLERLLAAGDRWPELGALYEHIIGLVEDPADRADVEYRLGALCETRLDDGQRALTVYGGTLEAVPTHEPTRAALEGLFHEPERAEAASIDRLAVAAILEPRYRADEDWAALVPLLEAQQAAAEDVGARIACLREIASIQEGRLSDVGAAFATCGRVLQIAPADQENRDDLHRLAIAGGTYEALGAYLREVLGTLDDETLKVQLLLELGLVEESHLVNDDAARECFSEILAIQPDNQMAINALVDLYSRTAAWERLVELYLSLAEQSLDPEEQKTLYFKVCQLLTDVLDDPVRAIATYRKVLDVEPDNGKAFKALEGLYTAAELWADLADLLREEIRYAEDPTARASLRHRYATVAEEQLGDVEEAVEAWRAVVQEDQPEHTPSLSALERQLGQLGDGDSRLRDKVARVLEPIYEERESWAALARVLEVQLLSLEEPWARLEALRRIAELHEGCLEDAEQAFDAYARAFGCDYGNPDLQTEIDRLAEQLGAWQALVETYLGGIEDFDDLDEATQILLKVAGVFDQRLAEPDRAIDCYRRVLLIDEANAEALNALERILAAEGRHSDLVTVLSRKVDFARDVLEKKELLYQICEIWEDVLDRPDQAINTYRRVLEEDPEDQNAIEALIRLYERTGDSERLVQVLREKLEVAADDEERKQILYRIARVAEEQLSDANETILTYRSVLETDPLDQQARDALDRLYSREGRWGELIDLLETERDQLAEKAAGESSMGRVDALEVRIAHILQERLGQVEQSLELYGEILDRNPAAIEAQEALERVLDDEHHRLTGARVLARHFERSNMHGDLARIYETQLLDIDDRVERLELLKALAKLQHHVLNHPRSAFECYGRAFHEDATDSDIVDALDALADELKAHEELSRIYESRIEATLDSEVERGLVRRLARLYDVKLAQQEKAIQTWQAVIQGEPYDAEALEALDRLYTARENWGSLIDTLGRRIEVGGEAELDCRFRLGYLLEVVEGDVGGALEQYQAVVWSAPENDHAVEALERLAVHLEYRSRISEVLEPLYRDAEAWDKLAILTEMRIELAESSSDRARLWMQSADLREKQIGDADGALEALLRGLEEVPDDPDVRDALIRLATERGAWSRLVSAFEGIAPRLDDAELRLGDLLQMADWCRGRLNQPERAMGYYEAALEIDAANERALDALERLYTDARAWPRLVEVHRRKADAEFDLDEKRRRLLAIGALCADELDDPEGATSAYEAVVEIDPADLQALGALEKLHERSENWAALYEILERRAENVLDPDELVTLHRRLGGLARGPLQDPARAADAWEKVLDHEPGSTDALVALRTIYEELEDWARLQDVQVKELSNAEDDAARSDILFRLAENAETNLDRSDNAIEYYRQIHDTDPAEERAILRLEALYEGDGRWFDLVETLRAHLESIAGGAQPERVVELHVRIAQVAQAELQDADLAIRHLNEVLEVEPNHARALNVLAGLYERNGDWEKCASTLARAIEHAPEGPDRGEAYRRLGLLHLERLDQPDEARVAFEAAVDSSGDREALGRLIELAMGREDAAEVLRLSEQRLALAADAEPAVRLGMLREIAQLRGGAGDEAGRIAALEEAYGLDAEDRTVADALLAAYFEADRHAEAEPVLDALVEQLRAQRRMKDLIPYVHRRGVIAEEAGDEESAMKHYTECFEYDATYLPNLFRLGKLHFRRDDWEKALKIFQTMLLHQMNLDSNAQRVEIFYHLGVIRRELGDARKAKDMFNRALGYDPDHAPSKEALAAL